MKKLILILLIICSVTSYAEPYSRGPISTQLGFSGSTISGYGLSFWLNFGDVVRLKTTGFYFYNEDNWSDFELYGVGGAELQFLVYKSELSTVYIFGGASLWYNEDRNEFNILTENQEIIKKRTGDKLESYTAGIGVGYEYLLWDNLLINLDVGVQYQDSRTTYFYDLFTINPHITKSFGLGAGLGISYLF